MNIFNASAACRLQLAKFHRVVLNLFLTLPLGDLHCQSSASDTYAPKAHLQAEMTIDGIMEGISAKFMITSASLGTNSTIFMITSARFMTISASSVFILRFLEHTPPPVHASRAADGRDIHRGRQILCADLCRFIE